MLSKSALSITMVLALALTSSVEAVELTDGTISRTGFFGGTSFSLEGPGLSFSGSFDNLAWQQPPPCTPCFPGEPQNVSSHFVAVTIELSSNTVVTIDGTTFRNWGSLSGTPPFPFAILTSSMQFNGGVVEVPFSDEPALVLIAPFTMSGDVGGRWGLNNFFGVSFTGSGFLSLHVQRIGGSSAYTFQAITYKIAKEINIDVKPGDDSNFINTRSGGKTPVAILSTPDFDAATVNPLSIRLAGAPVSLKKNGTTASSLEDVNGDGLLDLVVHVSTEALQLTNPDQVLVEAETIFGESLWATDELILVP